jgi:hypothetical protein
VREAPDRRTVVDGPRHHVSVEDDLEEPAVSSLLRKQDGVPRRPPDPIEGGPCRVLRQHRRLAGPQVHHRHGPALGLAPDLVRPVQELSRPPAFLVDRVHVVPVVPAVVVDVQVGLVRDHPLLEPGRDLPRRRGGPLSVGRRPVDRNEAEEVGGVAIDELGKREARCDGGEGRGLDKHGQRASSVGGCGEIFRPPTKM